MGSGSVLNISAATWSNAGTITATGAKVTFGGNWTNTGTLNITSSKVSLTNKITTAQLIQFYNQGDTVTIVGTLNNTGGTLNVGAGSGWARWG